MKKSLYFTLLIITFFFSCIRGDQKFSYMMPSIWRGTLQVSDQLLPFNFEVTENDSQYGLFLLNGKERIGVLKEDIIYSGRDSVTIQFPHYHSYIKARYNSEGMDGDWIVTTNKDYILPFRAKAGQNWRFTDMRKKPFADLTGRWEAVFEDEQGKSAAIGEFIQKGNHLEGTFLTETGDYRFLVGTIQDDKAFLSCFDGSHAFLFEFKLINDELVGIFWAGKKYKASWTAKRNEKAMLPDADTLTSMKKGMEKFEFSFPDVTGKKVALTDEKYKGKTKIIQIMGTWCPNCADETVFLQEIQKELKEDSIAIIGLAFEKHEEFEKAAQAVRIYKKRFDVKHEVLIAGTNKKEKAAEALPMLNGIKAYPTMIIVDKHDKVRRIHTGFSGPATAEYPTFKQNFIQSLKEITENENKTN